jgi:uncharacterized protein (DUF488 family)
MRELGAPREVRHKLRNNGDWEEYRQEYELVLDRVEDSLHEIKELAQQLKVVLLCFERDYTTCHRSLSTTRMQQLGLVSKVKHLHPQREKVVDDVLGK